MIQNTDISKLIQELNQIKSDLNYFDKIKQKEELEKKLSLPETWKDRQGSEAVVSQLKDLTAEITLIDQTEKLLQVINPDTLAIKKNMDQLKARTFFSDTHDRSNAYLQISAGTGGVDAQDWAEILLRMYLKFCQDKGWKSLVLQKTVGEEAGIKNASLLVSGDLVYGHLKAEAGVHRLVRKSPFNAKNLRQTSFALVEVSPVIEDSEVTINPDDLKVETFRSRGAGGQSVNTTDSAVRITHIPSGISVSCQNERSQLQNKEMALKILKSKLVQLQEEKKEKELSKTQGELKQAAWGNQIRSYVFDPYKLVKDHRTNYEETNVQKVLEGHIEKFIEEYLKKNNN